MALNMEQIDDYVESVLDHFERNRYTDLTLKYRHKCAKKFFDSSGGNWGAGARYQFKVKTGREGNARVTGVYDKDVSNVAPLFDHGNVPWSMYTTNFSYDINEEAFQAGAQDGQILIDYLRAKSDSMYEEFWDLMEEHFFTKPATANQPLNQLLGLEYWIVKNGSIASGARNGGNPPGFPLGAANIDADVHDLWNNWTFAHDGTVTLEGFIDRVNEAQVKSHFEATHAYPALVKPNTSERFVLYTTFDMLQQYIHFCRAQNSDLGPDGMAMFGAAPPLGGNMLKEVPYLTENFSGNGSGDHPIYGINTDSLKAIRKRGKWLKRQKVQNGGSHTTRTVHVDSSLATVCTDRKANFVGHMVA